MAESDRVLGSIFGLAVGDALGAPVEFKAPGTFRPVQDMRDGGAFGLRAGQWTDDTSMALCLTASLTELRRFDPLDQLERYLRWYEDGYMSSTGECFDIGNQTRAALHAFRDDPANTQPLPVDESSAGNGSLMRLAPVPLAYRHDRELAVKLSGESSRTTHPATVCVEACMVYGAMILAAVGGSEKQAILSAADDLDIADGHVQEVRAGSYRQRVAGELPASGWVIDTLQAALWAFDSTANFRDGALAAVNLGHDADTVGAVYGQLAGAHYGLEAIPDGWVARIAQPGLLTDLAESLVRYSPTAD